MHWGGQYPSQLKDAELAIEVPIVAGIEIVAYWRNSPEEAAYN